MGRIKSKIFLSNVGLKPSPAASRKKRQNLNTFDIFYSLLFVSSVSFNSVALYSRLGEDKFVLYFLFDACFMRRRLMRGETAEVEKHDS